jgi:hypothetical protein
VCRSGLKLGVRGKKRDFEDLKVRGGGEGIQKKRGFAPKGKKRELREAFGKALVRRKSLGRIAPLLAISSGG